MANIPTTQQEIQFTGVMKVEGEISGYLTTIDETGIFGYTLGAGGFTFYFPWEEVVSLSPVFIMQEGSSSNANN